MQTADTAFADSVEPGMATCSFHIAMLFTQRKRQLALQAHLAAFKQRAQPHRQKASALLNLPTELLVGSNACADAKS